MNDRIQPPESVRALLDDAGVGDELRASLEALHALGAGAPPPPSPEVAALLIQVRGSPHIAGRRGALIALVLAASLGAGVTAAAADPGARDTVLQLLRPAAAAPVTPGAPVPVSTEGSAAAGAAPASISAVSPAPSGSRTMAATASSHARPKRAKPRALHRGPRGAAPAGHSRPVDRRRHVHVAG
jgi:hypothetical protein